MQKSVYLVGHSITHSILFIYLQPADGMETSKLRFNFRRTVTRDIAYFENEATINDDAFANFILSQYIHYLLTESL